MTAFSIDHVILAVRDLELSSRRIREAHGFASYAGGAHPQWGTANRIVPMGAQYLELLGVVDPARARDSSFGRWVQDLSAVGDRLAGWVVSTNDIEGVAARLGVPVQEGSRRRPGGTAVRWRAAGIESMLEDPALPFFIEWPGGIGPGAEAAEHARVPLHFAWLELGGDAERLGAWLGDPGLADLPIRFTSGPRGLRQLGIATASGEIVLA